MNKQWIKLRRADDVVVAVAEFVDKPPAPPPLLDDHPQKANFAPAMTDAEWRATWPFQEDDEHYVVEGPVFVREGWKYLQPGWDDLATQGIDHPA